MTGPKPRVIRKDATIENTGADDDFPGTFEVILSAPTEDRDGDTLLPDEWKQPLPDHITFDSDHGMSVATTVGSGVPALADDGTLRVKGTYSSLDRAQDVRTLVNEGHIRTTSVAFMTVPSTTKGKVTRVRELLNGAFVAVPSNREALVLESKGAIAKAGARNSSGDLDKIQQIYDLALQLGATSPDDDTDAKKSARWPTTKAIAGSLELTQSRIADQLRETYPGQWSWVRGTVPDGEGGGYIVFQLEDPDTYETTTYRQSYTDDGVTVVLAGDRAEVEISEVVTQEPPEATADQAAATDLPPAPAGASKAAAADADELEVKAARYRALAAMNTSDS